MKDILSAPSPYNLVHEAESLISTVEKINGSIVTQRRDDALSRINGLHSQVVQEVETAGSDDGLKNRCLSPLESLRRSVESQESVAHIAQAVQEAERALDGALVVVVKSRKEIKPSSLMETAYLENREDIEGFLDALRRELEEAIAKGERIQIR